MVQHLYKRFLADAVEYESAQARWRKLWDNLIATDKPQAEWKVPWFASEFVKGTPMRDGNPIFSAVSPTLRRGVRILQHEPTTDELEFDYWQDTFASEEPISELVISCALSDQAEQRAADLIRSWVTIGRVGETGSSDPIDAILQSDQAKQQRRKEEDHEIKRHRRRAEELHVAFAAVGSFTTAVFDELGYQKSELTTQEFIKKWADLWIALGDQLRDKKDLLARQPEDLRDEQDNAPRAFALAVLKAAVQRDNAKVVNLFQRLTTASGDLQAAVEEWLRRRLERLIMGYWTVGDGGRPEREGWESDDDWQALLIQLGLTQPRERTSGLVDAAAHGTCDSQARQTMPAKWTHAPRNPREIGSFMEEILGHFNKLRKAAGLPEVGARVDTIEDCKVWACVLAESNQPRVYVLSLYNPLEVEQEHNRHVADAHATGELVWSFKGNAKDLQRNLSPEALAEEIWRQSVAPSSQKDPHMMALQILPDSEMRTILEHLEEDHAVHGWQPVSVARHFAYLVPHPYYFTRDQLLSAFETSGVATAGVDAGLNALFMSKNIEQKVRLDPTILIYRMDRQSRELYKSCLPKPKIAEQRAIHTPKEGTMPDARNVFVIHGRNAPARNGMFDFLRALGLNPIEWDEAVKMTGKGSPYIGEILDAAFSNAQAVVAILTGDEFASLREEFQRQDDPDYEKKPTPQARPNVLFEAGMAFGRHAERTIVVEIDYTRPFSDVVGRHTIPFRGDADQRNALRERLKTAGCAVKETGNDWLKAGNFEKALTLASVKNPPRKKRRSSNLPSLLIGPQLAAHGMGFAVLQAAFGIGENWAEVTTQVNRQVSNGRLKITPPFRGDELGALGFPDPAPNQKKLLVVLYTDKGVPAIATAWPEQTIDLPLATN